MGFVPERRGVQLTVSQKIIKINTRTLNTKDTVTGLSDGVMDNAVGWLRLR